MQNSKILRAFFRQPKPSNVKKDVQRRKSPWLRAFSVLCPDFQKSAFFRIQNRENGFLMGFEFLSEAKRLYGMRASIQPSEYGVQLFGESCGSIRPAICRGIRRLMAPAFVIFVRSSGFSQKSMPSPPPLSDYT